MIRLNFEFPDRCFVERRATIVGRAISFEFVGSFYNLSQLPKDRLPEIAIAGRSNVGKSSLINRLARRKKLAKISKTPGKTRSLNFFRSSGNYYLVDLPGYGYAKVSKVERRSWRKLVGDYLETSQNLAGLVLLVDGRRELTEEDRQLLEWLAAKKLPAVIVITKIDKLSQQDLFKRTETIGNELGVSPVLFSAVSGVGRNQLMRAITNVIGNFKDTQRSRGK